MFSAKWVIWGSVLVNVIFTILTPVAANISYIAVLVVRFIEGLGAVRSFTCPKPSLMLSHYVTELFHFSQGVSLPAIHVMLTKWALPQERNLISSLAYAGKDPIVFSNSSVINVDEWTNNRNGFGHCHLAPILRHFG